jgi:hypothetical protein
LVHRRPFEGNFSFKRFLAAALQQHLLVTDQQSFDRYMPFPSETAVPAQAHFHVSETDCGLQASKMRQERAFLRLFGAVMAL